MKTLKKLFSKKLTWGVIIIVILASVGVYYYYANFYLPTGQSEESALQTATVRPGDLIIYISGSGTLVAASEASFGFDASSQVKNLYTKVGDVVEAGQVTHVDKELYQSSNISAVTGIVQMEGMADQIKLPVGTSATIEIIHERVDNAVLVPIEALQETTPGRYIVYLVENGKLTQRDVEIGLQDQISAEVKSGLNAGDVVSTDPVNSV